MNPYASLSTTNWTSDPETVIRNIFEDYKHAEYSATKLYRGRVKSLPYTLMVYDEETKVAAAIQNDLETIYKCHFDAVDCSVSYEDANSTSDQDPRYRLSIALSVVDGNKRYDLQKVLFVNDNKRITE